MLSSSVFSKTENITANSPLHINQMHLLKWTEIYYIKIHKQHYIKILILHSHVLISIAV